MSTNPSAMMQVRSCVIDAVQTRLSLETILLLNGFNLSQPYSIEDAGDGTRLLTQEFLSPPEAIPSTGEVIQNILGRYFLHAVVTDDRFQQCKTVYPATKCSCGQYRLEWSKTAQQISDHEKI